MIIDWKTSQKKPKRKWLADRIQTHLYPFILLHAGNYLNGGIDLIPDQISMLYWFVNNPNNPEAFQYTPKSAGSDKELFTNLIYKIISSAENDFLLTQDQAHCRFCKFRSLCGRGERVVSRQGVPRAYSFCGAWFGWDPEERLLIMRDRSVAELVAIDYAWP